MRPARRRGAGTGPARRGARCRGSAVRAPRERTGGCSCRCPMGPRSPPNRRRASDSETPERIGRFPVTVGYSFAGRALRASGCPHGCRGTVRCVGRGQQFAVDGQGVFGHPGGREMAAHAVVRGDAELFAAPPVRAQRHRSRRPAPRDRRGRRACRPRSHWMISGNTPRAGCTTGTPAAMASSRKIPLVSS